MQSSKLRSFLATPSIIANFLDWRKISGTVLTLDIHKNRVGVAIASHPFKGTDLKIETIHIQNKRGELDSNAKKLLSSIISDYKVCGVIVSWPVQKDNGRLGAACGRVLHTLENLLEDSSSSSILTPDRPLCLWDGNHTAPEAEDDWGRNACYGGSTAANKTVHSASMEQYYQDENMVAKEVWFDFMRTHWPELRQTSSDFRKECTDEAKQSRKTQRKAGEESHAEHWEESLDYARVSVA